MTVKSPRMVTGSFLAALRHNKKDQVYSLVREIQVEYQDRCPGHTGCAVPGPSGTWDLFLRGALIALWQCSAAGRLDVTSHR